MNERKLTELMQELDDTAACVIYHTDDGVRVKYAGATQNVLPTLRAGIKSCELLRAACADVVDECLVQALHVCGECPLTLKF